MKLLRCFRKIKFSASDDVEQTQSSRRSRADVVEQTQSSSLWLLRLWLLNNVCSTTFAQLRLLNYVCSTTFVPSADQWSFQWERTESWIEPTARSIEDQRSRCIWLNLLAGHGLFLAVSEATGQLVHRPTDATIG
eukprot:TRINITY_DN228_c0_g1_i14.p2 TRINITY_DN228_c0_g1~~TRINITY_DN228_c0_g1_i14.p2  ORF type:complete len:135 (-),score=4.90 TRINITY_DN228_c0_g1_i14:510-914(-)